MSLSCYNSIEFGILCLYFDIPDGCKTLEYILQGNHTTYAYTIYTYDIYTLSTLLLLSVSGFRPNVVFTF